jgi:hypothetical protein
MIKEGMYAKLVASTKLAGPNAIPPLKPEEKREGEEKWNKIIDKNLRHLRAFSDSRVKMKMKK